MVVSTGRALGAQLENVQGMSDSFLTGLDQKIGIHNQVSDVADTKTCRRHQQR